MAGLPGPRPAVPAAPRVSPPPPTQQQPALWATAAGRPLPPPSQAALAVAAARLAPTPVELEAASTTLAGGPLAAWQVLSVVMPGGNVHVLAPPVAASGDSGGADDGEPAPHAAKRARVEEE